jgi:hypothetical protein
MATEYICLQRHGNCWVTPNLPEGTVVSNDVSNAIGGSLAGSLSVITRLFQQILTRSSSSLQALTPN